MSLLLGPIRVTGFALHIVRCLLFSVGLVLESGPPFDLQEKTLRLQLLSRNSERDIPVVGARTLIVELVWALISTFFGEFRLQTWPGGTPTVQSGDVTLV